MISLRNLCWSLGSCFEFHMLLCSVVMQALQFAFLKRLKSVPSLCGVFGVWVVVITGMWPEGLCVCVSCGDSSEGMKAAEDGRWCVASTQAHMHTRTLTQNKPANRENY